MKFIKDFLFLDLSQYESFGLTFPFPIGFFLTILTLAACITLFIFHYYKSYTTLLYKQLMRHGANSEESAKTLAELKLLDNRAIRRALSRNGQATFVVKRADKKEITYEEYLEESKKRGFKEEKIDFDSARFYISPDRTDVAKKALESSDSSIIKPIIISIALVAILAVLAIFLPDMLSALNKSLS